MSNMWISGIGDRTLSKVVFWMKNYDRGRVCATKKFLTKPGEMGPGVQTIDMPTAKAVKVPWKMDELEFLIETLDYKRPDWPVAHGLRKDLPRWRNGKLQPGGDRVIEMAVYPEALIEMYTILMELKYGKAEATVPVSEVDFDAILSKDSRS